MSQRQWIGTPLHHFFQVSIIYQHDSRYLYGGVSNEFTSAAGVAPLPVDVLQGADYGYGQLKTSHLLPKSGIILLEITNNHATKTLVVGGCVHGLKVRL